jgi:hypothetical protein
MESYRCFEPGSWSRWATAVAVGLLCGCGERNVDQEDELGGKGGEGEDQYELVVVDGRSPADLGDTVGSRSAGVRSGVPDTVDAAADTERVIVRTQPVGVDTQRTVSSPAPAADRGRVKPASPIVYDSRGEFTVQVGIYQDAQKAGKVVRELSAEGYPAYAITSADSKAVRVRIGYFKTREEAQRFGEIFKKDRNVAFWVDRRANEKF